MEHKIPEVLGDQFVDQFGQSKWWLLKFASKFWSEMEICIICSFDWWRIHWFTKVTSKEGHDGVMVKADRKCKAYVRVCGLVSA